jgi:hypothetical protein
MAGGWCYVKELAQPHYARRFAESGIAALVFDYRGFGSSEGEPRQHIDPWAQIEDYNNALSYACSLPEVDADRAAVWGISYSGGHALIVAANDPRVRAVVSTAPLLDGWRNTRAFRPDFDRLQALILEDKATRFRGCGPRYMPMFPTGDANEVASWPQGASRMSQVFERYRHTEAPLIDTRNTVASMELVLNYSVFPFLPRLVDKPALMLAVDHGAGGIPELEQCAFDAIGTAEKRLVYLEDTNRLTLYGDPEHRRRAADIAAKWLAEVL